MCKICEISTCEYFSLEKVKSLFAVCKVWQSTIDATQVCNCEVEQHIIVIIVHTGKRPYHTVIPGTLGLGKGLWTDVAIFAPPTAVNNMKIRQICKLFANKKRKEHVKQSLHHSHAQVPLEVFICRTRMNNIVHIVHILHIIHIVYIMYICSNLG
jgi:hypothetical protein